MSQPSNLAQATRTMRFQYTLTEKFRAKEFIRTAVCPDKEHLIKIDPTTTTQQLRQLYVAYAIYDHVHLGERDKFLTEEDVVSIIVTRFDEDKRNAELAIAKATQVVEEFEPKFLDEIDDDAWAIIAKGFSGLSIAEFSPYIYSEEDLQKITDLQNKKAVFVEKNKKYKARLKDEEKAKQAKIQEQLKAEEAEWIKANGSEWLKSLLENGYNYKQIYLSERADIELGPNAAIDFHNMAEWDNEFHPSPEGLAFEKEKKSVETLKEGCLQRVTKSVVLFETEPPFEAFVVQTYAGRPYDVYVPIDGTLRTLN